MLSDFSFSKVNFYNYQLCLLKITGEYGYIIKAGKNENYTCYIPHDPFYFCYAVKNATYFMCCKHEQVSEEDDR